MLAVRRALIGVVVMAATTAGYASAAAGGAPSDTGSRVSAFDSLACVTPTDATAIDTVLRGAYSPMAGTGRVIVDAASAVGIDPRFIVAIASHETMLETYGPAQAIRNPFGLGPGLTFATEADAVRFAVDTLSRYYLAEGRTTIDAIGSKWAPVGADNDPSGLNKHWTAGVSSAYARLGGDPSRTPLLNDQAAVPTCDPVPGGLDDPPSATVPDPPSVGAGPPVVMVWGGNAPASTAGTPAPTMAGFAFPLAVRGGGDARYSPAPCDTSAPCTVDIETAPSTHVVASSDGRLIAGTAEDLARGIAFWLVRPDGGRIGYGPLASYAPGVSHGAVVALGQPLGLTTGTLAIAWTRDGVSVDPYPLLSATRAPDPAG